MGNIDIVVNIICVLSAIGFLFVRLKYELQMSQQNSYRNTRYIQWLRSDAANLVRLFNLTLFVLACFFINIICVKGAIAALLICATLLEIRKKYKKKLIFTNRAIRLYATATIVSIVIISSTFVITESIDKSIIATLLLIVTSFALLIISNILNSPLEKMINRGYYNDAKRILEQNKDLIIIGITGSYGKTSTKHYLHRILSEKYNVLMTPGSYNTTLGVIRTVRENLKPYHEVFIVEMGAKQAGDIEEICNLVHPNIGILTSVGEQHLESFKTIENVQKTKFELIDSLQQNGVAVLNSDFEYITSREVTNTPNVNYYSHSNSSADYYIDNISYSNLGTDFTIESKGGVSESFFTKIVGSHNLSNILSAYIVAKELNIDTNAIRYAISHIEQVEHRLNIKKTPAGITIIDDAFNSNPNGAKMALDLLKGFQGGKRIVVTPGLIELGDKQFEYNRNFGEHIATSADYVIVVGAYNRDAIVKGLADGSFDSDNSYIAPTFTDAISHLSGIMTKGDVVLYENDLPDTFK